jgi:hypothetical protein
MKDYGLDSDLKPEKKKKRKFEVIINTKSHGVYSDFTLKKVAKKITMEIASKKKEIIFHLKEKGKIYGPYIGYIKDGKAVVRIYKMSGGLDDYDWNKNEQLKAAFLINCAYSSTNRTKPYNFKHQFKVLNQGTRLDLVIFGSDTIIIGDSTFLPYIYYLHKDNIKFKKISNKDGNIFFEDVSFDILSTIEIKNWNQIPNKKSIIQLLYEALIEGSAGYSTGKTNQQLKLKNKLIERMTQPLISSQQAPQLLQQQTSQLMPQQAPQLLQQQNNKNSLNFYRCEDPSKEVLVKENGNIFFGYDEDLLVMPPNISKNNQQIQDSNKNIKFYYKYSLRNRVFSVLKKENGILKDVPIYDIKLKKENGILKKIPIYDILCLYDAIKGLQDRKQLATDLLEIINKAKENISTTGQTFIKLDESNFNKQKREPEIKLKENEVKITSSLYKNFGKVKKRQITGKTYIFFGTNSPRNSSRNNATSFSFVCFREDNKVYFIKKGEFNKEIPLNEFTNIGALEDLISFILLRRMISETEKNFAEIILKEAQSRIKFLKKDNIEKKMAMTSQPSNYKNTGNGRKLIQPNKITAHSSNNTWNRLIPIPLNLITTLPISPNPIKLSIPIAAS